MCYRLGLLLGGMALLVGACGKLGWDAPPVERINFGSADAHQAESPELRTELEFWFGLLQNNSAQYVNFSSEEILSILQKNPFLLTKSPLSFSYQWLYIRDLLEKRSSDAEQHKCLETAFSHPLEWGMVWTAQYGACHARNPYTTGNGKIVTPKNIGAALLVHVQHEDAEASVRGLPLSSFINSMFKTPSTSLSVSLHILNVVQQDVLVSSESYQNVPLRIWDVWALGSLADKKRFRIRYSSAQNMWEFSGPLTLIRTSVQNPKADNAYAGDSVQAYVVQYWFDRLSFNNVDNFVENSDAFAQADVSFKGNYWVFINNLAFFVESTQEKCVMHVSLIDENNQQKSLGNINYCSK